MMEINLFWKTLRQFFTVYLPKQRNCSTNTIEACHKTWNMLIRYITDEKKISLASISFEIFDPELIISFLDYMENKNHWKPATRNQRLSCIRMYFKYASMMDCTLYHISAALGSIPGKKEIDKSMTVDFLSEEAVSAIVNAPDLESRLGLRDHFFLSLMYDTAARDCEMLVMKKSDFNPDKATVYLMGKGNKPRLVPVSEVTVGLYKKYVSKYHTNEDAPMFYTTHKGVKTNMSDDNVARFLKKYAAEAKKKVNFKESVHPHIIRKSRAMHLYRSGMPLELLAEFLGHSDPQVTLVYAYADTEMKRNAISKAASRIDYPSEEAAIWQEDKDIIERLCRGY